MYYNKPQFAVLTITANYSIILVHKFGETVVFRFVKGNVNNAAKY